MCVVKISEKSGNDKRFNIVVNWRERKKKLDQGSGEITQRNSHIKLIFSLKLMCLTRL